MSAARSYAVEPVVRFMEGRAARSATRILVLSEYSRRLLTADYPYTKPRISRAPGGVDVHRWHPAPDRRQLRSKLGVDNDDAVVFTARRLVARTGVDLLLRTFALVAPREPRARLVVAGDGENRHALVELAQSLHIEERVTFLGFVDDATLITWYQAADLFVLPTIAYEGFGMATIEALACGTPVVATPVGATPEIVRPVNPEWVADSATEDDLAWAISHALSGADDAARGLCRAYAVATFSWESVAPHWEDVLTAALASKHR